MKLLLLLSYYEHMAFINFKLKNEHIVIEHVVGPLTQDLTIRVYQNSVTRIFWLSFILLLI